MSQIKTPLQQLENICGYLPERLSAPDPSRQVNQKNISIEMSIFYFFP